MVTWILEGEFTDSVVCIANGPLETEEGGKMKGNDPSCAPTRYLSLCDHVGGTLPRFRHAIKNEGDMIVPVGEII